MSDHDVPKVQEEIDEEKFEKVKEIMHLLAKTVSLIKIYPSDHTSVKGFSDDLSGKMIKFLEKYWNLEIDIEEFSFLFQEKKVYQDDSPGKSLPLLFFKDGMQKIFFHKGLKKEQFLEFLEVIKRYYELPPEEADIVSLLWEKDFAHIRFMASDDYLEVKIGIGKELLDFQVDRETLRAGRIELSPEDKEELSRAGLASEYLEMQPEKLKDFDQAEDISTLSERESKALKLMLDTNRNISPEEELSYLILEILYLEDKAERFSTALDDLAHNHLDILEKGNFQTANQILNYIFELRQVLSSQSEENLVLIDKFLEGIKSRESYDSIKKVLLRGDVSDFKYFFEYLKSLGPESIPFLGEVFEDIKSPDFRLQAQNYLKEMGEKDYIALISLAQEERPSLTKGVIAVLGSIVDKRAVQFLANFITSRDKSIKREAILALSQIEDEKAAKILIGFLDDEDENLRILTAQNLRYFGDASTLKNILNIATKKTFRKKSRAEKQALLNFLGRSKTEEAFECLGALLKKSSFFGRSKQNETRLCAVKALEGMGTSEAFETLKKGTRLRTKKIRKACQLVLEKFSIENRPNNLDKGDHHGTDSRR